MLVHRLLDVVFRTLDAIDAVRSRVDRALGTEPQPPSAWSPEAPSAPASPEPSPSSPPPTSPSAPRSPASSPAGAAGASGGSGGSMAAEGRPTREADPARRGRKVVARVSPGRTSTTSTTSTVAGAAGAAAPTRTRGAKKSKDAPASRRSKPTSPPASTSAGKSSKSGNASTPSTAGASVTGRGAGRKGSVDRSGRDLDSARARAVSTWVREQGRALVAEDAALDGKRTLARVVWAVACAEDAGSEQGLTAADASALLSSAASVEVFATNVARVFRDEPVLFCETIPDGRSKRYKLTDAGRARLAEVKVR